jgi:hypothetical protein
MAGLIALSSSGHQWRHRKRATGRQWGRDKWATQPPTVRARPTWCAWNAACTPCSRLASTYRATSLRGWKKESALSPLHVRAYAERQTPALLSLRIPPSDAVLEGATFLDMWIQKRTVAHTNCVAPPAANRGVGALMGGRQTTTRSAAVCVKPCRAGTGSRSIVERNSKQEPGSRCPSPWRSKSGSCQGWVTAHPGQTIRHPGQTIRQPGQRISQPPRRCLRDPPVSSGASPLPPRSSPAIRPAQQHLYQ